MRDAAFLPGPGAGASHACLRRCGPAVGPERDLLLPLVLEPDPRRPVRPLGPGRARPAGRHRLGVLPHAWRLLERRSACPPRQMRDIADSGVDEVVSSWWGRGSREDVRLPAVMRAAKLRGLEVAVQLEPYAGRTIDSIASDLVYIRSLGIRDVYIYRTMDFTAEEWNRVTVRRWDSACSARPASCGSRPARDSPGSTPTTSSSTTQRSSTAMRAGACLRDPLRAVGRPRLRRAGCDGGHACQRPPARRDL